jgi:hypothetical protein
MVMGRPSVALDFDDFDEGYQDGALRPQLRESAVNEQ